MLETDTIYARGYVLIYSLKAIFPGNWTESSGPTDAVSSVRLFNNAIYHLTAYDSK